MVSFKNNTNVNSDDQLKYFTETKMYVTSGCFEV